MVSPLAPSWTQAWAQDLDPQAFVLTIDDLPAGFAASDGSGAYVSNEQSARGDATTLADFTDFGRQNGYEVAFGLGERGPADTVSFLRVSSTASVYATADGARGIMDKRFSGALPGLRLVSVPTIGDQTTALSADVDLGGTSITRTVIVLRKGSVIATVSTDSIAGSSIDPTVALAQKVAARLP